ncbi:MAG: HAD hydrolase family protein [Akkermansia sp.]|nr:HAD hydrolase family protein [Akkermansia sp.]
MNATIAEGSRPPGLAAPQDGPCRWLVSLDYDGTLRSESEPPVAPAFFELMATWRSFGVRWGINTGRSLDYLLQELIPCSPVLPDFICTCERYVYLSDKEGRLQPATTHNERCMQINLQLRRKLVPSLHAALEQLRHTRPELEWELAASDPLSIEAVDTFTMDALMPYMRMQLIPGATIQRAGRYLRFSDERFSKGTALRYISQAWQVPDEHIFIMGDGHNDLDAFCHFPHAFCAIPATAHPEILQWMQQRHTGYISPEAGVLQALQTWFRERVSCQK